MATAIWLVVFALSGFPAGALLAWTWWFALLILCVLLDAG